MSDVYATKQAFDGQRASIGRVVLVKQNKETILAAHVIAIEHDRPVLLVLGAKSWSSGYEFVATKTEQDVVELRGGTWTWPPRV